MKAREVFEASCGEDILGENRALVKVTTERVDRNSLEQTEEESIDMDNPVVEIHQNNRLTLVNLIFEDPQDDDFSVVSEMVRRFQTIDNTLTEDSAPGIAVTILPKEQEGVFIHGVSGIALLQASKTGGAFDTVSFVFTNDCIHAYAADLDTIDSNQLESDTFVAEHFGM